MILRDAGQEIKEKTALGAGAAIALYQENLITACFSVKVYPQGRFANRPYKEFRDWGWPKTAMV
jgi:hypothetical protein